MAAVQAKIQQIKEMGFDVDDQLLEMVLRDNQGDVDKALDELMTMNAQEILRGTARPPVVLAGSIRPAAQPAVILPSAPAPRPPASPQPAGDIHNEEIMQLKALALENLGALPQAPVQPQVPISVSDPPSKVEEVIASQVVPVPESSDEELDKILNINVRSSFRLVAL